MQYDDIDPATLRRLTAIAAVRLRSIIDQVVDETRALPVPAAADRVLLKLHEAGAFGVDPATAQQLVATLRAGQDVDVQIRVSR